jgi:diaminohydroxyphosphoribosylaminopyrimidine deaminase / 5-amino-6-(5-phosphoribosylamino)uracil reductase
MAIATDELFLRRALELAAQGTGLASPNPLVGAVVVDERGRIVGSGSHTYAGVKHAEVLAMEQAGQLARGNTLYLNLEPCSHIGRTGPCAEAVIAAGIARVVCCMEDPNPLVAGQGFAKLRAAGIEVEAGGLEAEARRLNESFARYIRTGLPFVTLKSAMSLDGKIAQSRSSGQSSTTYITGDAARRRVHEMRHASDAILVGIGTILADDPLLTDRSGLPRRQPLLRVVLDSQLRLPLGSRLVESAKDDVLVFCTFGAEEKRLELEARGVRVSDLGPELMSRRTPDSELVKLNWQQAIEWRKLQGSDPVTVRLLPRDPNPPKTPSHLRPDLATLLAKLGGEKVTSLLVEGGAEINWAFLRERLVDKLALFFAPTIFGPVGTVPWLAGEGVPLADKALNAFRLSIERFDEDFAVEAYLRDPYSPESRGPKEAGTR